MHKALLISSVLALLLAACSPQEEAVIREALDASSGTSSAAAPLSSASADQAASVRRGVYIPYVSGIERSGSPSVLFFHASWCPKCAVAEEKLTAWYADQGFPLSVYKVDYDTAGYLKTKYGIVSQHTFVLVDGEGNAIETIIGPSDARLQALLSRTL